MFLTCRFFTCHVSSSVLLWPAPWWEGLPVSIQQRGSCSRSPAAVLGQQSAPGGGGAVFGCSAGILQRGKLVFPDDLEHNEPPSRGTKKIVQTPAETWMSNLCGVKQFKWSTTPGERENIKNKLLHLYAIGFGWLDVISTGVHEGNLLDSNVLFQLVFKFPVK